MRMSESAKQAVAALIVVCVALGIVYLLCDFIVKTHPVETPEERPILTEAPPIDLIVSERTATQQETEITTAPEELPILIEETTVAASVIPPLASESDIELLARVIWGEAPYIESKAEQAAVVWCVLNRVDYYETFTIEQIVKAPYQFYYEYGAGKSVPIRYIALAADVVSRWEREHAGQVDVGRTLPAEYQFFVGDGEHNNFTTEWRGTDYWDWSLPSPYEEDAI